MDVLIYGFKTDISSYSLFEIFLYLLTYAVMVAVIGMFVERYVVNRQILQLLRWQTFKKWWRVTFLRTLIVPFVLAGLLFGGIEILNILFQRDIFDEGAILPVIIWCVNLCAITAFVLLCAYFTRGYVVSFFILIVVEMFSMYAGIALGRVANYLPGSYLMIRRTTAMESDMPIGVILIVEIAFVIFTGAFGHYLYRKRGC